MVQQESKDRQKIILGWIFFGLFITLIAAGIIVKRVFHHPELMMLFHLPAAVFLVLASKKLTLKLQNHYKKEIESDQFKN